MWALYLHMRMATLVVFTGCTFHPGPAADVPGNDGGPSCHGTEDGFTICIPDDVTVPRSFDVTAADAVLDTRTPGACTFFADVAGTHLCVRAAETITIARHLRVIGADPIVLLATDVLAIEPGGLVDVSGRRGEPPPAGATATACAAGTPGTSDSDGGGGGAGGSFGTLGGDGGTGKGGNAGGTRGGAIAGIPATLRGGCSGSDGGTGPGPAGLGAVGGGALYLLADTITIAGAVNASGAGGQSGREGRGGGGGGGSGGMIALYAAQLELVGAVFANGGGGGEGADNGKPGADGGDPAAPGQTPALGGAEGNPAGASGGDGAFLDVDATPGVDGGDGGGGGGGGAGVIRVLSRQSLDGAQVSPMPR